MPRLKLDRLITVEDFDQLLLWLDCDRERAGTKYEAIRRSLIKIFLYRGCSNAEDLADETINDVTVKVHDLVSTYVGDPALYFYGVANRVHLRYLKQSAVTKIALEPPLSGAVTDELRLNCLEQCIERLPQRTRILLVDYFSDEGHEKIKLRQRLAVQLGVNLSTLRVRVHRLKSALEACVQECVRNKAGE